MKNKQVSHRQVLDEAKRLLLISASGDEQVMCSSPDGRAHVIQCVKFRQNMTACVFVRECVCVCIDFLLKNDHSKRKNKKHKGGK